jgi:hypothetical protein
MYYHIGNNFDIVLSENVGWDSVVGIATHYGLDGPGIAFWWGRNRISTPVQTGFGAHLASCTMGTRSIPWV